MQFGEEYKVTQLKHFTSENIVLVLFGIQSNFAFQDAGMGCETTFDCASPRFCRKGKCTHNELGVVLGEVKYTNSIKAIFRDQNYEI